MPSASPPAANQLRRARHTRRSVLVADRLARWLIGAGGLFVIIAVIGIFVFLVSVVLPLFRDAEVAEPRRYDMAGAAPAPLLAEVNEYQSLGFTLAADGVLRAFDAGSGADLGQEALLPEGRSIRALSRNLDARGLALGLDDGTLILGDLQFEVQYLTSAEVTDAMESLAVGGSLPLERGVAERVAEDQYRVSALRAALGAPVSAGSGPAPVELLDYRLGQDLDVLAAFKADGQLLLSRVSRRENLVTGEITRELEEFPLPFAAAAAAAAAAPAFLLLSGQGDQLYLAWKDGALLRYDLRRPEEPVVAERLDLTPEGGELTALEFLIGEQTLVAGDSQGRVTGWFRVPATDREAFPDGFQLLAAHRPAAHAAAVRAIAVSPRDRSFATGDATGAIWLRHMTSDRVLARMRAGPGLAALQIAPKADGLLAWGGGAASLWSYRMAHPEVTPGSVFGATWYEGYSEPQFTWQSSSGTDDFEPKLSLVPLIFGTLKATFYALLFSVPIALLAAIYTSEFLSRRARSVVKPAIEMMASLPSVVLGFLAALVLAPWVEQSVLGVLFAFFLVPLAVVLGAYLWLFVPQRLAVRLDGTPKLALTAAVIVLALAAAFPAGRVLERACFAGDLRAWLAPPHPGNATGFWAALLFVPGVVCAAALRRRVVDPLLARGPARTRGQEAFVELLKGGSVVLGALALCWLGGAAMNALGLDPRGSLVGTYVQRNTLVVGFVMGFAVIPIIYTIAEDALSAVPDHLRGAALGCGATRWQTAIRVVVPTAMSGIFSACMIGLGRAVGETMIVVMAAGNTPILDVNVFNGLRALSATIAVELPEAVKGGTLYRMLFLAALTLFGMTFVVNTAAEVVRQRFRKRAFEL